MNIIDIVKNNACKANLESKEKKGLIKEISKSMATVIDDLNEESLFTSLIERENKGTTGFGNGIAIPHAKIEGLKEYYIGIFTSNRGVDYKSIDKKKCKVFYTIIGPANDPSNYLKILAQVSRVAKDRNAYNEMIKVNNSESFKEIFLKYALADKTIKTHEKKQLMLITLYETKFFDDVVEILVSNGIKGASVLDSQGIRNVMSGVPLFSEFINFLGEKSETSNTILAVVDKNLVQPLTTAIEEILGDLDKHSGAMILGLDISFMKGSFEVI